MQRNLIEGILAHIAAELPEFKTVDLFNDQFNKQDAAKIDSFRFPALFVSFPDGADYSDYTAKVQQVKDLTVRFYIADQLTASRLSIGKTVLEILDLKQLVFEKFQGWGISGVQSFSRVHEETDENRTNYYIFVQDYKTGVVDASKYIDQGQEVTLTLDATAQVIINPLTDNGIRTAKNTSDNV
jgi:hypothetical protein